MRTIDADALERDGWQMSRTVQIDKKTMEWQTRKPTDFPTIEPQKMRGHWIDVSDNYNRIRGRCSVCGWEAHMYEDDVVGMNYCPNCGADMREE